MTPYSLVDVGTLRVNWYLPEVRTTGYYILQVHYPSYQIVFMEAKVKISRDESRHLPYKGSN
jgi:hypothetical protein